ncbi:endonuclease/exonuclease/phosphatase family protein [Thioalkalivibrio sp. XN279]|uniref:endonuclease/exonuclease/phosphatase family protein n=1 Tax=Thioalkalivibrio sp. XN279 TaxID=2714953 RepID=UPI0014095DD2|nr:endonuclease/exonuclease/phosphatase family protein [Thioalkalivibrio sp. XN279]NHA15408.1 oxidoreductase [Thioalkalivibrio sp. XN279]
MVGNIEIMLRRWRRAISRSALLSRLLRLPVSEGPATRPGLVMIQVDGLSRTQFERALDSGELPFLRRLMQREHYRLHSHYSGLPSTTPAVQGELFYGVKAVVPAFSFRDHQTGHVVRMYDAETAARVEGRLASAAERAGLGEPLLKDGSAYADNYHGGADETHFCAASIGWGPALRAANPFVLLAFLIANLYSFFRVGVLVLLELGLAVADFFRGLRGGQDFIKELKFVPTRAGISILLREFCVIGGKIDISRGLPVIHMNFLGYDEQSHRRGPGSLFAHWTLKGIDDAVARLWRAASRSELRHYEVWIYSDHGQVDTQPYASLTGYPLENAVEAAFQKLGREGLKVASVDGSGIQTQRIRLLGGHKTQKLFARQQAAIDRAEEQAAEHPAVAALGPVGHIYFPRQLSRADRAFVARELVAQHQVPAALAAREPGVVRVFTAEGEYQLPQDREKLLGASHPFLDAAGEDLVALCEHADAGDLVLLGWRAGVRPITFAEENGAHAGAHPDETRGFALLPGDAPLADEAGRAAGQPGFLRPGDLRTAALRELGRADQRVRSIPRRAPAAAGTLRVMTYNVHSCVGMDGKLDPERIARVIARARPDVVALQELDVGRQRTGSMDQAQLIAHHLEMEFHFHPAMHLEEERYGDAVLTHLPMRLVKAGALPGLDDKPRLEPRGALWVAVEAHGQEVQVINTHLGLLRRERLAQVETLLGDQWLGDARCRPPVVFCGDLNAVPTSRVCRRLGEHFEDAQVVARAHRPRSTYASRAPGLRIDHVYVTPGTEVRAVEVPDSELARVASDHLPLVVELVVTPPDGR